jgi:creatinine amidohydrolase/Fe(II)-dependent formamide hydrolase-like protein
MHGPQLPLGCDTYIAEAVCRLAAEQMQATVFDTISYTWPGMTKYSKPTISMTMDMETRYTRMACDQIARNGFRRIYVVQFHGPGIALMRLAREFFEETGVPLAFYGLMRMPEDGRRECAEGGADWEASLCAAATAFLGCDATIDPEAWPEDDETPPIPAGDARMRITRSGALIGGLGTDDRHHGTFRGKVDADLGMAALRKLAASIASTADAMAEVRDAWRDKDLPESWPSAVTD